MTSRWRSRGWNVHATDVEPLNRASRVDIAELRGESKRHDVQGRVRVCGQPSERG